MAICMTPAIPVRITDYSETSLIALFLTRDFGQVRTIYKGARRKGKAYENTIDLLLVGELTFYERSAGLNIVKEFAPEESFPKLHKDITRYRAAMACLEFARIATAENEPAAGLFDLFREALRACAKGKHIWEGAYAFLMSGLAEAGFAPLLDICASCAGKDFPPGVKARTAFSLAEGGVLCSRCGKGPKVGLWLTREALDVLRGLGRTSPVTAASQELKPTVAREVRGFLRRYCEFTFEQRFRMLK